jgi:hypothetical protein
MHHFIAHVGHGGIAGGFFLVAVLVLVVVLCASTDRSNA